MAITSQVMANMTRLDDTESMSTDSVGTLCRHWRQLRRRSQLDLSVDVGVSTRHLSFVETGRARPSRELILILGRHLDVPLREQNRMLLAAGFAPQYTDTPLDDAAAEHVRAAIDRLLAAHEPYPGVAVDGDWNVVSATYPSGGQAYVALTGTPGTTTRRSSPGAGGKGVRSRNSTSSRLWR